MDALAVLERQLRRLPGVTGVVIARTPGDGSGALPTKTNGEPGDGSAAPPIPTAGDSAAPPIVTAGGPGDKSAAHPIVTAGEPGDNSAAHPIVTAGEPGDNSAAPPIVTAGEPGDGSAALPIVTAGGLWGMVELWPAPLPRAVLDAATGLIEMAAVALDLDASRLRLMAELDGAYAGIERELHDGLQQRLTTTGLEVRLVRDALPAGDPARAALTEIGEQVGEMATGVRELARRTFPAILADGGLGPALRSLARRAGLPVELDLAAPRRYPALLETTMYRIVSEVVAHAARTQAAFVSVRIAGLALIVVCDGTDPEVLSPVVRDRIDALGGSLDVRLTPGRITVEADFAGTHTG